MDVLLIVAFLVTGLVGGPVVAAVIVQRNGPWAGFLRRHVRSGWLLVAACWAVVAITNFWEAAGLSSLLAWVGLVSCVMALCLAFSARSQTKQAH
jgi:hypothetical protein